MSPQLFMPALEDRRVRPALQVTAGEYMRADAYFLPECAAPACDCPDLGVADPFRAGPDEGWKLAGRDAEAPG